MIIQRTTLLYAGVSLLLAGVVVGLFGSAVYVIRQDGQQLSNQFVAMNEETSREAAVAQLRRTYEETETERAQIAAAFLPGEGAAVTFLSDLEQLAPTMGVGLDIVTLDRQPESETTAWLIVSLSLSGSYSDVSRFMSYLETLPYRSYLTSASLVSRDGSQWVAEVELQVSERTL